MGADPAVATRDIPAHLTEGKRLHLGKPVMSGGRPVCEYMGNASSIGHRPRAFRPLAAYHRSVHVPLVAMMAAPIRGSGRFATGAAEA